MLQPLMYVDQVPTENTLTIIPSFLCMMFRIRAYQMLHTPGPSLVMCSMDVVLKVYLSLASYPLEGPSLCASSLVTTNTMQGNTDHFHLDNFCALFFLIICAIMDESIYPFPKTTFIISSKNCYFTSTYKPFTSISQGLSIPTSEILFLYNIHATPRRRSGWRGRVVLGDK
jgi:hypothetical protein